MIAAKGVTVIDDSYNSSPSALMRCSRSSRERVAARRIAVLGEMLELGDHSSRLHDECGREAAAGKLARLVTVGGAPARAMGDAAVAAGMPRRHVITSTRARPRRLPSRRSCGRRSRARQGSRGTRTDVVVDRLAEEFG